MIRVQQSQGECKEPPSFEPVPHGVRTSVVFAIPCAPSLGSSWHVSTHAKGIMAAASQAWETQQTGWRSG